MVSSCTTMTPEALPAFPASRSVLSFSISVTAFFTSSARTFDSALVASTIWAICAAVRLFITDGGSDVILFPSVIAPPGFTRLSMIDCCAFIGRSFTVAWTTLNILLMSASLLMGWMHLPRPEHCVMFAPPFGQCRGSGFGTGFAQSSPMNPS